MTNTKGHGRLANVNSAVERTIDLLASTRNETATRILIAALDSSHSQIATAALPALIARRSPIGEREVLRRLHLLGPAVYASLNEQRASLSRALRSAVVGNDSQLFINACHEILRTGEYDLIPTLLAALEDQTHPNPELTANTLLALVDSLAEALHAPVTNLQNPAPLRKRALDALQDSMRRFPRHQRREVVEAFCHLADRHQPTLLEILNNPHHPAYLIVSEVLSRSTHPAVRGLLLSFLSDPHPASAALTILARRTDRSFVEQLLVCVGTQNDEAVARNLKRIDYIAWVAGHNRLIDSLPEPAQCAAVRMAMASRMNREQVYALVAHLLVYGKPAARRVAALALGEFAGADANVLAVQALHDNDPKVQAHILHQLRSRAIPGVIQQLLDKLHSPHAEVRQAARESLSEFSIDRYLAAYDGLEPDVRRSTGDLVKQIDPNTAPRLRCELQSPVRSRRLRALNVAESLEIIPVLEQAITELLADEDGFVRSEAARCLATSNSNDAHQALERALHDPLQRVRDAAQRALTESHGRRRTDNEPPRTSNPVPQGASR